ncbi:hypothetical protein FWK35_00014349, partial [Aphis craccivora]
MKLQCFHHHIQNHRPIHHHNNHQVTADVDMHSVADCDSRELVNKIHFVDHQFPMGLLMVVM